MSREYVGREYESISGVKVTKSEERRAQPRMSTNATIILEREGFCEDYQVMDFSSGGMRVRGERPLVVNQDLSVMLYIERSEVRATGKVVWCKGPEDGQFTIGIKVEVGETEARAILNRYLATL